MGGGWFELPLRLRDDPSDLHVTVAVSPLLVARDGVEAFLTVVPSHVVALLERRRLVLEDVPEGKTI